LLTSHLSYAQHGFPDAPLDTMADRRLATGYFQALYKSAVPEGQRALAASAWQQPHFREDLAELTHILLADARAPREADAVVEGVLYLPDQNLDVFAVTLNKDEKRFSPTTRYEDRFISPLLFHWKSQSGTAEGSPTGLRYQTIGKGTNRAILFVREDPDQPYLFLGDLKYLKHEGSRPMGIDFELMVPMPAKHDQAWASIVAA